ncbi:hypothetical protein [Kibdelosporangium aridum]|uniref:hypothetical protein n=1 Tax=Kibdelosporangium aridum TaxID=2030 RepID=UPI0035E52E4B
MASEIRFFEGVLVLGVVVVHGAGRHVEEPLVRRVHVVEVQRSQRRHGRGAGRADFFTGAAHVGVLTAGAGPPDAENRGERGREHDKCDRADQHDAVRRHDPPSV